MVLFLPNFMKARAALSENAADPRWQHIDCKPAKGSVSSQRCMGTNTEVLMFKRPWSAFLAAPLALPVAALAQSQEAPTAKSPAKASRIAPVCTTQEGRSADKGITVLAGHAARRAERRRLG